VGIVENGSWGPTAGRTMKGLVEGLKDIAVIEPMITIKSTMSEENLKQMEALVKALTEV